MKRTLFAILLMTTFLAACSVPAVTEAPTPPAPASIEPTLGPNPPATTFEPQTYTNETVGFALDYPFGWTVNETVIGSRGSQVQFLSSPELANMETLPAGATRVNATIYQWDPKNDLAAYVANRKAAWDASGFSVIGEEQLMLASGLPAVQLTVQTPDRLVVFLYFGIGDQYLEINGEGNLELVKEIAYTLRPISR